MRGRRVVVNLVDGRALIGVRRWSWPWQIRLLDVHLARHGGGESVALDGTVIVPRHRVDFVQVVGG